MIDSKLRIPAGNTYATGHRIVANDLSGQPIADFDLQQCTDIQVLARNGGNYKPVANWTTDDQLVIVLWYGRQMKLGGYDLYIEGKFNGTDWRYSEATIFEIVQFTEEANIPADTILVDGTYFMDAEFTLITNIQGDASDDLPLMDGTADAGTSNKYSRGDHVHPSDTNKQDVISDLATIRSGAAAGAAAYQKPASGIPKNDLASGVQTSLGKADTALQPSALTGYATEGYVDTAVGAVQDDVNDIEALIPSAATVSNQLADKAFVNSSISTNTANFIGTFSSLAELQQQTATNNDYAFVIETDALGNEYYDRYKYNGSQWLYEYKVESTPFTASQWAAIQSGITSALVTKIGTALQPADVIDNLTSTATDKPLSAAQGKALNDNKQNTIDGSHKLSADLVDDTSTTNKFVTSSEKTTWNDKQAALVSGTNIKTINNESILGNGNISIQGGEANVIESISINGTTQTITNKNVDLPVPVSVDIDTIVKVTQAAYDALATKDSSTLYLITSS